MKPINLIQLVLMGAMTILFSGCGPSNSVTVDNSPAFSEDSNVRIAVLSHMLLDSSAGSGKKANYTADSAYFVDLPDAEEKAMIEAFKGNLPPLKPHKLSQTVKGKGAEDLETGGPAMIFYATVRRIDGLSAEVTGGWYAAPRGAADYIYTLKKIGGSWRVIKIDLIGMA